MYHCKKLVFKVSEIINTFKWHYSILLSWSYLKIHRMIWNIPVRNHPQKMSPLSGREGVQGSTRETGWGRVVKNQEKWNDLFHGSSLSFISSFQYFITKFFKKKQNNRIPTHYPFCLLNFINFQATRTLNDFWKSCIISLAGEDFKLEN